MLKLIYLTGILFSFSMIFAQAEMPQMYYDYIKINENTKKIKDSRIKNSTTIFISNGKQDTTNISYYDLGGKLAREFNLIPFTIGSETRYIYQKNSYIYDEYGRVIKKTDSAGNSVKISMIEYGDTGDLETEEIFDTKQNLLKEISHEYDNLGRLVETNEKDIAGNCKSKKTYTYDSYNHMASYKLKSNCIDSAYRSVNITYVYKYDNKSNIIEKNSLYGDQNFKTESFQYGLNGKVIQSYTLTGNEQYTVYLYFYDKSDLLTKTERTEVNSNERKKYSKTFKYDNSGNLTDIEEFNETGAKLYMIKYIYENY